jgi:hypothetical protein
MVAHPDPDMWVIVTLSILYWMEGGICVQVTPNMILVVNHEYTPNMILVVNHEYTLGRVITLKKPQEYFQGSILVSHIYKNTHNGI